MVRPAIVLLAIGGLACQGGSNESGDSSSGPADLSVHGEARWWGYDQPILPSDEVCAQLVAEGGDALGEPVEVGEEGAFTANLAVPDAGDVWVHLDDCASGGTWRPSINRVPRSVFGDLADGATAQAGAVLVISENSWTPMMGSYQTAGGGGDPITAGALLGRVMDGNDDGIGGATVSGDHGGTVYYADPEPSDGLFGDSAGNNVVTNAQMTGFFFASPGPLGLWTAEDGLVTGSVQAGSWAGVASFVDIVVE